MIETQNTDTDTNKLLPLTTSHLRRFSTKYTAQITSAFPDGRTISVTVTTPPPPHKTTAASTSHAMTWSAKSPTSSHSSLNPQLSDHLKALQKPLTPLEASHRPHKALTFFNYCKAELDGFKHDCFSYNRLLLILSKVGSSCEYCEMVRRVVEDMGRDGVCGNIATVNILIGVSGSEGGGGGVEESARCLELVKKWRLKMSLHSYKMSWGGI